MGQRPPEIIFLSLIFLSIAERGGRPGRLQCSSMLSAEANQSRQPTPVGHLDSIRMPLARRGCATLSG